MDILNTATILAIDDEEVILSLLELLLENRCKEIILEQNPNAGLELARIKQPNLILLDVLIGKVTGYNVCQQLKADKQTAAIPVIFLSSLTSPDDKVKGFEAGGVDFISKPFDINEVIARIESCLATHNKIQQSLPLLPEKTAAILQQYQFNRRELEILRLYISGYKRSEIAAKIYVSENTVKWYLKQIFQKLSVDSRAALIEKIQITRF